MCWCHLVPSSPSQLSVPFCITVYLSACLTRVWGTKPLHAVSYSKEMRFIEQGVLVPILQDPRCIWRRSGHGTCRPERCTALSKARCFLVFCLYIFNGIQSSLPSTPQTLLTSCQLAWTVKGPQKPERTPANAYPDPRKNWLFALTGLPINLD